MKHGFIQRMAWLHTWAGLVAGWLLFVIFVGGTIACFDTELDRWTRPGIPAQVQGPVRLDAVVARLLREHPRAGALFLSLPTARYPAIVAGGWDAGGALRTRSYDAATGQPLPVPDSSGGGFFFALHYDLHAGSAGMYIVGLAGMLMLLAIATGVVVHRRIFKDFFTFRPRAGGQRAWLDGHNLTAVLGLPFHLVIAYTGVAIFVSSYMPAGLHLAYGGDMAKFHGEAAPRPQRQETHRPLRTRPSLEAMVADAGQRLGAQPWRVSMEHPGDAPGIVSIALDHSHHIAWNHRTAHYDGATGRFMQLGPPPGPGYHAWQFMGGLHTAQFGSALYRWLYFLLGLAGCVMIASGLQVWLEKRGKRIAEAGVRSGYGLVRVLNVGVVAGMPLAAAAMLWANRLLPVQATARVESEIAVFCIAWAVAGVWAVFRVATPGRAWRDLWWAGAGALAGLPVLGALTTDDRHLAATLGRGDWAMAAVDLVMLALALAFALLGWRASRTGQRAA